MKKYKVSIQGMTCTSCEEHVTTALKNIGAKDIKTSYCQGKTEFNLAHTAEIENIEKAIEQTNYQIEKIEEISSHPVLALKHEEDYDYDFLIIGSGSAAFSAAIKATEYGARVGMVERDTIGGTCVNIGCVPSKTLIRAGSINQFVKENPFNGLKTTAGEVDLKALVVIRNASSTEAANIISDDDHTIALKILEYNHFSNQGNVVKKRSILIDLGRYFEPKRDYLKQHFEGDIFKGGKNPLIISRIFEMLNKLQIRHQDEYQYISLEDEKVLEKWYDATYNTFIFIIISSIQLKLNEEFDSLKNQ